MADDTDKDGNWPGLVMKYFVLKPRGDDMHAEASRAAMLTYASMIAETNPVLSSEMSFWVNREAVASFERKKAKGQS